MSVYVMSRVWKHGPKDQGALLVLLALADFADDDGHCWPAVSSVAQKARMSERNARRVLRKLETDGYLVTEASSGRTSNRYKILSDPDNMSASLQPGQMAHPTRTNGAPNPDICAINPDTAMSAEPSIEPSRTVKEPSERADARHVREVLCSVFSEATAADFIAHRKAKRAKLTPRAADLIAKKLAEHPDPDAVALLSIENGWTGIFPEKVRTNGQPAKRSNLELGFIRAVQARTAGG